MRLRQSAEPDAFDVTMRQRNSVPTLDAFDITAGPNSVDLKTSVLEVV